MCREDLLLAGFQAKLPFVKLENNRGLTSSRKDPCVNSRTVEPIRAEHSKITLISWAVGTGQSWDDRGIVISDISKLLAPVTKPRFCKVSLPFEDRSVGGRR